MEHKKVYASEFIGTLTLTLAVLLSVANGSSIVATPVVAALTLGLFVYTIGKISGCHINPAVTIGLWSRKMIPTETAVWYVVAQFLGAVLATIIFIGLVSDATYTFFVAESMTDFWAEFVGMAVFTFGIASVATGKAPTVMSGVVIGGSLLVGILLAANIGSAGILNPAVALALGSVSISYLGGMVGGSVLGIWLYTKVN